MNDKKIMCFSRTECFGLVLKWSREAMLKSQLKVAQETGVDLMTISRIENGNLVPTLTQIGIFADYYGLTDAMLLQITNRLVKHIHSIEPHAVLYPERHEKGWFPGVAHLAALFFKQELKA